MASVETVEALAPSVPSSRRPSNFQSTDSAFQDVLNEHVQRLGPQAPLNTAEPPRKVVPQGSGKEASGAGQEGMRETVESASYDRTPAEMALKDSHCKSAKNAEASSEGAAAEPESLDAEVEAVDAEREGSIKAEAEGDGREDGSIQPSQGSGQVLPSSKEVDSPTPVATPSVLAQSIGDLVQSESNQGKDLAVEIKAIASSLPAGVSPIHPDVRPAANNVGESVPSDVGSLPIDNSVPRAAEAEPSSPQGPQVKSADQEKVDIPQSSVSGLVERSMQEKDVSFGTDTKAADQRGNETGVAVLPSEKGADKVPKPSELQVPEQMHKEAPTQGGTKIVEGSYADKRIPIDVQSDHSGQMPVPKRGERWLESGEGKTPVTANTKKDEAGPAPVQPSELESVEGELTRVLPLGKSEPGNDSSRGAQHAEGSVSSPSAGMPSVTARSLGQAVQHSPAVLPNQMNQLNQIEKTSVLAQLIEKARVLNSPMQSEVLVSLKPEFLGRVQLRASMVDNVLVATIRAESASVRQLIESQLPALHQSFHDQGLQVGRVEVTQGGDLGFAGDMGKQSPSQQNWDAHPTQSFGEDILLEEPERDLTELDPAAPLRHGSGVLNVVA
ncbi:MAG: flagellar hook-length control protein FliK [Acidobacteriota bacterium]